MIKRPAETMSYLTVKRKGYVTVKLRKELAQEIDAFLDGTGQKGYASRAEFVKDAVRRLLDCYSDERA
jgi:metal-responsive CopG/Arc/MetJ family transcriptional regulator